MKTNNKKLLILVFGIIAVALAVIGSVLLVTAVGSEYDISIGHFAVDAVLAPVAFAVMAVGAVLGVVLSFLVKGVSVDTSRGAGLVLSFVSVFSGALILAAAVFGFFDPGAVLAHKYQPLIYIAGVVGIAGALGTLIFAMSGSYKTKLAKGLSLCFPVYFILRVLILYFDTHDAVNGSVKVMTQLMFIAYALFATFDSGLYIGKKVTGRYFFGCIAAVAVGAPVGIASVITQFTVADVFRFSVVDTCMVCGVAILAAVKLFHAAMALKEDSTEDKDAHFSEDEGAEILTRNDKATAEEADE